MPYLLPHEDVFLAVVGGVIAGLLVLRIRLARRRRESAGPAPGARSPE